MSAAPDATVGPFGHAAPLYRAAGWADTLPLPPRKKFPPPTAWTGRDGHHVSGADLAEWLDSSADGNIALRLPTDVIGIDVDAYADDRDGGAVLAGMVQQHGALPPTWTSTSRRDGVSGIRLFRVPEGLHWPGKHGNGIDLITYRYRYVVAWPSVHPEGGTYRWIDPDGRDVVGVVPTPADLPQLPQAWVEALSGGKTEQTIASVDVGYGEARAWVTAHGGGPLCDRMTRAVSAWVEGLPARPAALGEPARPRRLGLLDDGVVRHDTALGATAQLVALIAEGHTGGSEALGIVKQAMDAALAKGHQRDADPLEFGRMVAGAVGIALATITATPGGTIPHNDPCTAESTLWTTPTASTAPPAPSPTASTTSSKASSAAPSGTAATPSSAQPSTAAPASPSPASGASAAATSAPTTPDQEDPWSSTLARPNSAAPQNKDTSSSASTTSASSEPPSDQNSSGASGAALASTSTNSDPDDLDEYGLTDTEAAARFRALLAGREAAVNAAIEEQRRQRHARRILDADPDEVAARITDGVTALTVKHQADRAYKASLATPMEAPAFSRLDDLLAEPDEDVTYRIDALWPTGGRVVLAAAAKTGKSTLVGNVLRNLADGTDFLGRYTVTPSAGTIALIDNELSRHQVRRWLREQGITDTTRIVVLPLRGRTAAFDITDPTVRAEWATLLREHGVGVVVFDCLRPLIDALGLEEARHAGIVLTAFDALLAEAGVAEALVVHHMGHGAERSRGDSKIRDWPDVEWKMTRQRDDDGAVTDDAGQRFFAAFGRDVSEPEQGLGYDENTRHLTVTGGSRATAKTLAAEVAIAEILRGSSGMSGREIEDHPALKAKGFGRPAIKKGVGELVSRGKVRTWKGDRNATMHALTSDAMAVYGE